MNRLSPSIWERIGSYAERPYLQGHHYVCAIDPAFASDLFAIAIAHAEFDRVIVDRIVALTPPRDGSGLSPIACIDRVRAMTSAYRCPRAMTVCKIDEPRLRQIGPDRAVACHLHVN